MNCEHKFIHKETTRRIEQNGRSYSNCATWIKTDSYFCEKCLEEREKKSEWNGLPHYADRPEFTKQGEWKRVVI